MGHRRRAIGYVVALQLAATAAIAGDLLGPEGVTLKADPKALTARDITLAFFRATPGERIDFSGRTLRDLDLSGLNFGRANLTGADLFGSDLTNANLAGVDLAGGNLNRTTLIKADFSGANLRDVHVMRPNVSTSLDYDATESPKFAGADMRNVRMTAKMVGADFRGTNLTNANLGPHEPRADISSMPNSVFKACDFSGATLTDINFANAILIFSRFVGADLRRANLVRADLSKADLSGADLTGADLTEANLDEANLAGARGLDTVRGRDTIKNLERALR